MLPGWQASVCRALRHFFLHQRQRRFKGLAPFALDLQRDHLVGVQPVGRLLRKGLHIEAGTVHKRLGRAHGVDTGQKAANPLEHIQVVQLGRTTTAQGADRKIKTRAGVQGLAIQYQRGHHRHFGRQEFSGKVVFFLNLWAAPATGSVKLENNGRMALHRLVQVNTVDPVFVRTERQQTAVGPQTQVGQGVHHTVGRQFGIGVSGHRFGHAPIVTECLRLSGHPMIHADKQTPVWIGQNQAMPSQRRRLRQLIHRGLLYSLALTLTILGLGGVGFWLIDPQIQTLSDGLWLAFTTAATVGFGDLVPSTPASRMFSVVVVLLGLAVLSLVTASLSAIFVEKEVEAEDRQIEKDLMREISRLRDDVAQLRRDIQHRNGPPPDQGH